MNKLFFVRHGETAKNIGNKLHESGDAELLNPKGVKQIQKVSDRLRENCIDIVYHSSEARAVPYKVLR